MKLHFMFRQLIGQDIKTTGRGSKVLRGGSLPHECLMLLSPRANGPLTFTYALNFSRHPITVPILVDFA